MVIISLWALQNHLDLLEYNRQEILSGEIWRIWTGHLVHTNMSHFALNILAAIIIYLTFFMKIKPVELLLNSFLFATLISLMLLSIYPDLDWYNGLSGLLHALLIHFSARLAKNERTIFWAILLAVWIKVLNETMHLYSGYKNLVGDMLVISEAHLIGTIFGTITALICMAGYQEKSKQKTQINESKIN